MRFTASFLVLALSTVAFGQEHLLEKQRPVVEKAPGRRPIAAVKYEEPKFVTKDGTVLQIGKKSEECQKEADEMLAGWAKAEKFDIAKVASPEKMRFILKKLRETDGEDISVCAWSGFYNSALVLRLFSSGTKSLIQDDPKKDVPGLAQDIQKEIARKLDLPDAYWDMKITPEQSDAFVTDFIKSITAAFAEGLKNATKEKQNQ